MVQQSWPKVWVKKDNWHPKQNGSKKKSKPPKQLAEQIAAELTGADKCTYSRDLLLKKFTPEKAILTPTATASTPPTTDDNSKGSSLVGSPSMASDNHESKDGSSNIQNVYEQLADLATPVAEYQYNWHGDTACEFPAPWNHLYGFGSDSMPNQFPFIPEFPVADAPANLPLEKSSGKKGKRKTGKSNAVEVDNKVGMKATKADNKPNAKEENKAGNKESPKVGNNGGVKTGAKMGKKGERLSPEMAAKAIAAQVTTMMLRNIPNECTRDQLFELLENHGFKGKIDFIYLPINFSTDRNFGYAFLNFRTVEGATAFNQAFNGAQVSVRMPMFNSDKVCKVVPAAIQGWEANMRKLRSSYSWTRMVNDSGRRVLGPEHWHPVFLDESGQRVDIIGDMYPTLQHKTMANSLNPDASEFQMPDGLNPNASEYVPGVNTDALEYMPNEFYQEASAFEPNEFPAVFVEDAPEFDDGWIQHLARIQIQIEFYFSASNLEKDFYLKSLMDEDGWVQLSALAQFNRLRQMNADAETIARALCASLFVELSTDAQKVRSSYPTDALAGQPDGAPLTTVEDGAVTASYEHNQW